MTTIEKAAKAIYGFAKDHPAWALYVCGALMIGAAFLIEVGLGAALAVVGMFAIAGAIGGASA